MPSNHRVVSSPRPASSVAFVGVVAVFAFAACSAPSALHVPGPTVSRPAPIHEESRMAKARKVAVFDELHGTKVPDPYRWMEEAESPDVNQWTAEQNAQTRAFVDPLPGRADLAKTISELLQVGVVFSPAVRTVSPSLRRYFHTKREGAQNQPVLYVRDGVNGPDRALVDVSTLSRDGTTSLDWWFPSWDGKLVAWGSSESGNEESSLHVRDVSTGTDLDSAIQHTRHSSVAWLPDGKGFYYSRYPEPGSVPVGDEKYSSKIFFHKLGSDPKTDSVVFGDGREKTDTPMVSISPNGRWLLVRVHQGWDKSELHLKDLKKNGPWVAVAAGTKRAIYDGVPRDEALYIHTNDGAPRYELYAAPYDKLEKAKWRKLVSESVDVLDQFAISKNEIAVTYLHDGASRIERLDKQGKKKGDVVLPTIGSAGVAAAWDGSELFVSFVSFVVPPAVFRVDLTKSDANVEEWARVGAKFGGTDIEVSRLYATSKDGTRVPMFVVAKKGLERSGKNKTVLYGYGGFNVNQTPSFSARVLTVVQKGGVWVTAALRGGGELGESWHQGGMREKKQNVFDDFIACAETLVKEKITSPDSLGIMGGSNGGLLVAAAATQRPDLFRVGLSLVPLTDMIRYHRFRIAKLWIPEYGSSDEADAFRWLYAYSPYHRVKDGTRYPSMMFTTAESDSRVDPMHARKMAARMQEAQSDPTRPILLRVETKAGHGAGKPVSKLSEELTDELAFLFHELGVP